MINKSITDSIKDALPIADVVGKYVSLRRAGKNLVGVCPFHNDTRPSMSVSPWRGTFKCFVCGQGGDVIEFVKVYENVSFPEAVEMLGRTVGIQVQNEELTDEQRARQQEIESMRIALKGTVAFFQKHLPKVQKYLDNRGFQLTDDVIKSFAIGYAPENNLALKEMKAASFSEEILKKVGVLATSTHGRVYDFFHDRIMFPFFDLNGNITGFSGRFVTPKENTGKYTNTGETPLFTKGKQLFGLYQARQAIGKKNNVYLVEGQFDVLSLHSVGVDNTIAGSGTALTPEQVKLINRFTRTVTLVYDSDKAGLNAALKNCELLLQAGLVVQCVSLPKGMDPDNIAQQEKENTGEWLMKNTIDFTSYFMDNLRKTYNTQINE